MITQSLHEHANEAPARETKSSKLLWFVAYLVIAVVTTLIIFNTAIPFSKLMEQKEVHRDLQTDLTELTDQNKEISKRISNSRTDNSITEIAHQQYNLVFPGQKIYVLLP